MPLLSWILVGLALGLIARFVTRRRPGIIWTTLIGLAGGLIGGLIGQALGWGGIMNGFSIWSFLLAIGVSVVLLIIFALMRPLRVRRG
jgi:uncharacterized membrane protein YeaQ/YmgE (transglycosylase-associated protein family)